MLWNATSATIGMLAFKGMGDGAMAAQALVQDICVVDLDLPMSPPLSWQ